MTIHTPAFADHLPDEIKANVRRTRSFAELIADLGRDHTAHVADLDAFEKRVDAFGEKSNG